MLKSLKRINFQVADLDTARQWYTNMLNMQPFFDMPYCTKIGDTFLSLLPGVQAPAADSKRTAIYWEVDNIEDAYKRLIDLGASPYLEIKTLFNIKIAQAIDPLKAVLLGVVPGILIFICCFLSF